MGQHGWHIIKFNDCITNKEMNAEEKYEQALARARELYNAAKVYDFTDDMKRLE